MASRLGKLVGRVDFPVVLAIAAFQACVYLSVVLLAKQFDAGISPFSFEWLLWLQFF